MTDPLTSAELQTIRDRADRCLAGPWRHRSNGMLETAQRTLLGVTCFANGSCIEGDNTIREAHAEFLAAARDDIPRLIDEVERLQREVERLKKVSVIEPRRVDLVPTPKMVTLGIK
jgi:hypothetical protein